MYDSTMPNETELRLSKQEQDLLRIYRAASGKQQINLMKRAYELEEENKDGE